MVTKSHGRPEKIGQSDWVRIDNFSNRTPREPKKKAIFKLKGVRFFLMDSMSWQGVSTWMTRGTFLVCCSYHNPT